MSYNKNSALFHEFWCGKEKPLDISAKGFSSFLSPTERLFPTARFGIGDALELLDFSFCAKEVFDVGSEFEFHVWFFVGVIVQGQLAGLWG